MTKKEMFIKDFTEWLMNRAKYSRKIGFREALFKYNKEVLDDECLIKVLQYTYPCICAVMTTSATFFISAEDIK